MELVLLLGVLVSFFLWLRQPPDPSPPMDDETKERYFAFCLALLLLGAVALWVIMASLSQPAGPV